VPTDIERGKRRVKEREDDETRLARYNDVGCWLGTFYGTETKAVIAVVTEFRRVKNINCKSIYDRYCTHTEVAQVDYTFNC